MALINHLRASVKTIGEHCGIPEPAESDYVRLSDALENIRVPDDMSLEGDVEYAADQPAPAKKRGGKYNDPDLIEAAKTLVDEMVGSGIFDWDDLITSIQDQLEKDDPFVTPKQFKALLNIADRGEVDTGGDVKESWWEIFEADNPEAARVAQEQAQLA